MPDYLCPECSPRKHETIVDLLIFLAIISTYIGGVSSESLQFTKTVI